MQSSTWYVCPFSLPAAGRCWLLPKAWPVAPSCRAHPAHTRPTPLLIWPNSSMCMFPGLMLLLRSVFREKERENPSSLLPSPQPVPYVSFVCLLGHICVCICMYIPSSYTHSCGMSHQLVRLCLISWIWMSQMYLESECPLKNRCFWAFEEGGLYATLNDFVIMMLKKWDRFQSRWEVFFTE